MLKKQKAANYETFKKNKFQNLNSFCSISNQNF
jgi:hypothetical protein